jgi:predicted signal transduction protein with EAL and GGDEF domain
MSSNLANFWRSYVYIGVLTYTMGALAVVVYSLTTPGPNRHTMVILGFTSLAASIGPFRWAGLRLVSTRWSKAFFTSWATCTFVFIAVGAVLDGGVHSPISYFLVLPMLFAGLAYSAGTVTLLAAFGMLTTLVVGLLTPHRSWSTTAFLAVAMVIAGAITAVAALTRDRLMGQLMEAASVDALTGCLSRGAFEERLEHEAKRARRHHSSFSLIVADVDNLKTLNDSSGHHSGDRALRLLAGVLGGAARETDVVGRLGGDEFAMLLHGTDEGAALIAATG